MNHQYFFLKRIPLPLKKIMRFIWHSHLRCALSLSLSLSLSLTLLIESKPCMSINSVIQQFAQFNTVSFSKPDYLTVKSWFYRATRYWTVEKCILNIAPFYHRWIFVCFWSILSKQTYNLTNEYNSYIIKGLLNLYWWILALVGCKNALASSCIFTANSC